MQQKQEAADLMSSTEQMMKFGFMSMSMTYFSSLNMVRAMKKVGAQDTVMTIDGKSITVVSVSGEDTKGWDAAVTWEDVLSLGEQQRMGIARLLYHGPKFGLLDECTSAVSVDAEEQLYKAAIDLGITCVTVSQRLTLPEFHAQERSHGR